MSFRKSNRSQIASLHGPKGHPQSLEQAREILDDLIVHATKASMPAEVRKLNCFTTKGELARITNAPTEALSNLIKRIKRIGFGFRNFENYRIRALLYAGKPNWRVLGSIVVR
jgi:hypothetical protein